LVARAVKAFGFNATLAPVLDLGLPESAQVMGTRIAAATVAGVMTYARAFLNGLAAQGVVGCAKHFPGLGGGMLDSHLETPAIHRDGRELWLEDLAPYRDLRDELPMVMVNHATYPETPGKTLPASVSPYWITTVLRKRIGYEGIVFSDDLEMGGILKFMSIEEAVVAAVRAGMDLMEICHSPELILRAYEALIAEAERSRGFAELITTRARRTEKLRAKLFANGIGRALTQRQFEALRTRVFGFGEMIARYQAAAEAPIA
jgi:beta-N-acetylhexosaminidase